MIVEVIGIALHSETMEEMVVYIHNDPVKGKEANTMWVRPANMFLEEVDKGASANTYAPGIPGAKPEIPYKGPRFVYVREK